MLLPVVKCCLLWLDYHCHISSTQSHSVPCFLILIAWVSAIFNLHLPHLSLDCQTSIPFDGVVWTSHRHSSMDKLLVAAAWINQGQLCPPWLCAVPDCSLATPVCKHPTQHCGLLQHGMFCCENLTLVGCCPEVTLSC